MTTAMKATKASWTIRQSEEGVRGRRAAAGRNAPFVLLLALWGVALALIEILGFLPDGSRAALVTLWTVAALPIAWMVSTRASFSSGFLVGFLMVAFAHLVTLVLWPTYVENNPRYVAQWLEGALRLDTTAPMYELLTIVPVGLLNGIAIGALAWMMRRTMRARRFAQVPR